MSSPKVNPNKLRNIFYSILILLPSFLTGNIYSTVDSEQSTESILSSLSAINTSLASSMADAQSNISYRLRLLLSHHDFTSFNIEGMSKHCSQFLYYSPTAENIYIVDTNYDVIYGTNDTLLSGVDYTNHVDTALEGSTTFYSTFVNNAPFAQFALPITSGAPDFTVLGAMVLTYDFTPLETQLKSLNSSSVDLHAYLFDENGRLLITSSNQAMNLYNQTVDIAMIKQGISYSYKTPFKLFDDTSLIGLYYTIPHNNWTLLLTSAAPEGESDLATQALSLVSGLFGLSGIAMLEGVRKKNTSPLLESILFNNTTDSIASDMTNSTNTPDSTHDTHLSNTIHSNTTDTHSNSNTNTIGTSPSDFYETPIYTENSNLSTYTLDPNHWDSLKKEV